MIAFRVQLTDKKVRVVLKPRGTLRTLYAQFSYRGQRHNITTGQTDETAARKEARQIVEDFAANAGRPVAQPISAVVESYLVTRWPAEKGVSYKNAKSRMRRFAGWCEAHGFPDWHARPLREARSAVQLYIDKRLEDGMEPQTLKSDRICISAFGSFLMIRNRNEWEGNPAAGKKIVSPRVARDVDAPIPDEQVIRFLDFIHLHPITAPVVLVLSGVRPGHALESITWGKIDLERRLMSTKEKLEDTRPIPLSPWAAEQLRRFVGKASDRVWTASKRDGFKLVSQFAIAAGTPKITLQALRRAFTKRLYEMDASPQMEAKVSGHSVEVAMQHYFDLNHLDAAPVIDRLDWSKPFKAETAPKQHQKAD